MSNRSLQVAVLVVLIGCSVWLWSTPALYPIKLFVVLLHELSHGFAAFLTGGEILSIEINELIGGSCQYRGGNRVVVASAGYLGSLLWGGVILVIASRTTLIRGLGTLISGIMIIATLLWIRNPFGVLFTVGSALLLFILCRFLPSWMVRILLQFLGTASCLYVLVDIYEDVFRFSRDGSDAHTLASLTDLPAWFWGVIWGLIALVMILYSFYLAGQPTSGSDEAIDI
ncbi:MAG: M50 family metallopeptidase [Candidatus Latescibacterota bacterium]|nr:M50 family metallopeptidase [Candidatus Latescibacterota bacterium]